MLYNTNKKIKDKEKQDLKNENEKLIKKLKDLEDKLNKATDEINEYKQELQSDMNKSGKGKIIQIKSKKRFQKPTAKTDRPQGIRPTDGTNEMKKTEIEEPNVVKEDIKDQAQEKEHISKSKEDDKKHTENSQKEANVTKIDSPNKAPSIKQPESKLPSAQPPSGSQVESPLPTVTAPSSDSKVPEPGSGISSNYNSTPSVSIQPKTNTVSGVKAPLIDYAKRSEAKKAEKVTSIPTSALESSSSNPPKSNDSVHRYVYLQILILALCEI